MVRAFAWLAVVLVLAGVTLAQERERRGESFHLDKPIKPQIKLELENAYRPDEKMNVANYRGKIVLLRAVAPE